MKQIFVFATTKVTRFGFRVVDEKLVKDLRQQEIIMEMKDMRRRGMILRRISAWLYAQPLVYRIVNF